MIKLFLTQSNYSVLMRRFHNLGGFIIDRNIIMRQAVVFDVLGRTTCIMVDRFLINRFRVIEDGLRWSFYD